VECAAFYAEVAQAVFRTTAEKPASASDYCDTRDLAAKGDTVACCTSIVPGIRKHTNAGAGDPRQSADRNGIFRWIEDFNKLVARALGAIFTEGANHQLFCLDFVFFALRSQRVVLCLAATAGVGRRHGETVIPALHRRAREQAIAGEREAWWQGAVGHAVGEGRSAAACRRERLAVRSVDYSCLQRAGRTQSDRRAIENDDPVLAPPGTTVGIVHCNGEDISARCDRRAV